MTENIMEIITKHPLLDEILDTYQTQLGTQATAYHHHCYRVLNFYTALVGKTADNLNKGAIAIAFHDLGIWTEHTLDYLKPSVALAQDHLKQTAHSYWIEDISAMIDNHHKITAFNQKALVEGLRKADWLDVSLGMLHFGLNRQFIEAVQESFPNAGFHPFLVRLSLLNILKHPLKPLPIFKW